MQVLPAQADVAQHENCKVRYCALIGDVPESRPADTAMTMGMTAIKVTPQAFQYYCSAVFLECSGLTVEGMGPKSSMT